MNGSNYQGWNGVVQEQENICYYIHGYERELTDAERYAGHGLFRNKVKEGFLRGCQMQAVENQCKVES
jgi:hypothetical protein